MPVHAAHLRAELGLPLPDHLLGVLLLEQVHETHGERSAGARDCVDVRRRMSPRGDFAGGDNTGPLASWRASRSRPEIIQIWLAQSSASRLNLSERTARAAACFASLHRYNMPAHIRAAQQVSRTFPPSATRARASNIVARASTSRADPANPKNIPQGRDYTASRARGDDFDRRSEADARDPDPSHSRLQAIQAAKGHVHLKGSSMVSLEAPRSLLRPRGNQRVPLRTSWQRVTKLSDAKSCDETAPD